MRRWLWGLFITSFSIALLAVIALAALVWSTLQTLPSFEELVTKPRGQSVSVRAADGSILAQIGPLYGEWLAYNALPSSIREAMVAVEDRRFYQHIGVDPIGLARAIWVNIKRKRWAQGGSTITQQVAKNLFLSSARTFDRKSEEMVLALALDYKFSKEQILELYLNRVYFGGGAYGVDAASRTFFGHSARNLSLAEAAIIAGLVKAPSRYAPSSDPRRALGRAKVVIQTMLDSGRLNSSDAAQINIDRVVFAARPRENNVRYFTDWVLTQAEALVQESERPIEIITTLDPRLQKAAESAITRNVPEGLQGAMLSLGYDGAIKAMVGGKDYVTSPYNRATQAQRQPGSAFKLFVYLAALENGRLPDDVEIDEPVTFDRWSPVNNNRRFAGPLTLTQAFALSINTIAVKLADQAGFDQVANVAQRLGISTRISRTPSMALGTSEVSLQELTAAYASIARGGALTKAYGIRQIIRDDGAVLYSYSPELPQQGVSIEVASMMTQMMASVVQEGTGRAAQLDRPVAGKTGTTSDNKDGWFVGFTGDLTTGVWLGRDDAKSVPGLAGGRLPTLTWADFMRVAVQGIPPTPLLGVVSQADTLEPDAQAYDLEAQGDAQTGLPAQEDPLNPPEQAPQPTQPQPASPEAVPPQQILLQKQAGPGLGPAQSGASNLPNQALPKAKLNKEWLEGVLRETPPPK
jgi:penicillin-binding protein 1A